MTEAAEGAYRRALIEGGRVLGLSISEALADAMALHHALVTRWASRISLTTVTDPARSAVIHGLDSLLFLEALPSGPARVVDVGSGAGFPGVVLALARPDLTWTLLEPRRKRASFLRVALTELSRPDVQVLESRLEPGPARPPFPADVLLSRATIPPLDLVGLAAPKLAPAGRLVITSGSGAPPRLELEAAAQRAGLVVVSRRERTLPGGDVRILDLLEPAR